MFTNEEDPHIILPDVPEIIMEVIMSFMYHGVINQMIPKTMKNTLFEVSKFIEITSLSSLTTQQRNLYK